MLKQALAIALGGLCLAAIVPGQETNSGLSIPITISGDIGLENDSSHTTSNAGFRVVIEPALRFGPHWFFYSAVDAHSSAYFGYETGAESDRFLRLDLMQAFIGYVRGSANHSFLVKAGQLSSAFGSFPIEYDEAKMPLIDAPLVYTANLPIRPDQLPCGVNDIVRQEYDESIVNHCGGSTEERYGLTPVTLYGLPSVEVQASLGQMDARLQVTNSSPANPHGLLSGSQFAQWTAGAGYTFPQGFHVGVSGFRGPYLDESLLTLLPATASLRSFPATGIGIDAHWSKGPWTAQGEWMHFNFDLPALVRSPSETAGYAEMKRILSPRLFISAGVNVLGSGPIRDASGVMASHSTAQHELYELAVGYRLNRQQLLKAGGGWDHENGWSAANWTWPEDKSYSLELQLVTSLDGITKAFH